MKFTPKRNPSHRQVQRCMKIPQYEINWGEPEAFALVVETAQDGARIAQEKQQREKYRQEAEKGQTELV